MRTLTSAERAYISDPKGHDCFAYLFVTADDWTTFKNLGALSVGVKTRDFFNAARLANSIDSNTLSFSATLKREIDVDSLSPFRTDSAVNDSVVSPGTYAPLLDLQRQWRIMVAIVPKGTVPDTSDYRELESGYIRSFSVNGLEDTIEIQCMGMEAPILDAFVVQDPALPNRNADGDREYSGLTEDVIQQALDDQMGEDIVPLYVPGGATSETVQDAIGDINLQPAVSDVAALIGAMLRYRYDAADVNRYTLFLPPRGTTTPDFTIAATEYEDLSQSADVTGVRNLIAVRYVDASAGLQTVIAPGAEAGTVSCVSQVATFSTSQAGVIADGALIVIDYVGYRVSAFNGTTGCTLLGAPDFTGKQFYTSASMTRYQLQVFPIDLAAKSQLTDATAVGNLANAVLTDRQDPSLVQRFKAPGLWFVQLCDYVTVTANNVHADEDHSGGVTAYTMTFADGMLDVEVFLADTVKGRFTSWKRIGSGAPAAPRLPVLDRLNAQFYDPPAPATNAGILYSAQMGQFCQSVLVEIFSDVTYTTNVSSRAYDISLGDIVLDTWVFPNQVTDRDKTYYLRATPYSGPVVSLAPTGIAGAPLYYEVYAGAQMTPKATYDADIATINTDLSTETAARIAADALKADLASPTFTGDPKAPTPSPGDNDTSIATTAFVTAALAAGTGVVGTATGIIGEIWNAESVLVAQDSTKLRCRWGMTLTGAEIVGDVSGSITIEVYTSTYAAWNTFTKISASAPLTLSSQQKNQPALTGWTTTINAGDYVMLRVTGTPASLKQVTVALHGTRT